jgi:hypothetical protein
MINMGQNAMKPSWDNKQLDKLTKEEFKKYKKVQAEGEFFGRPSNEDLYDSDIDEDELEEEKKKEEAGDMIDMDKLLEQNLNDNQIIEGLEHKEEQVSESESEEEDINGNYIEDSD